MFYSTHRPILLIFYLASLFRVSPAVARLVNITVDDQNPDPLTGNTFTYSPSDHWQIGNGCKDCAASLDPSQVYDATWHDASYFAPASASGSEVQTASLEFNGSAIYVYGIISQSNNSFPSTSYLFFFIDGQPAGNYTHIPLGLNNTFDYNVSFWSSESLNPGPHRFELQNGQSNGNKSLVLFDYAVYTTDDATLDLSDSTGPTASTETQPSRTSIPESSVTSHAFPTASASSASQTTRKAIIASVVTLSVITVAFTAAILFYLCRRKARRERQDTASPSSPAASITPFYVNPSRRDNRGRDEDFQRRYSHTDLEDDFSKQTYPTWADSPDPLYRSTPRMTEVQEKDTIGRSLRVQNREDMPPPSYASVA